MTTKPTREQQLEAQLDLYKLALASLCIDHDGSCAIVVNPKAQHSLDTIRLMAIAGDMLVFTCDPTKHVL